MPSVVTFIGTRPQYIKAVPVSLSLETNGITEWLVDSGQHYDYEMSKIFHDQLGLKNPDQILSISGKTHSRMTGEMLIAFEEILSDQRPDACLIYGDTNTSLAGALAAAKLDIPVAHIEGGIRTRIWNPEEVNRRAIDSISRWIFCPTHEAHDHLKSENRADVSHYTGDVMFDTLLLAKKMKPERSVIESLGLEAGRYVVLTTHRPENLGTVDKLKAVIALAREEARGDRVVFPAHPRVKSFLQDLSSDLDGVTVTPPIGYLEMVELAGNARHIVTDSGGLQKEGYFHRVPVTVANTDTPWPVLRAAGWLRLGSDDGFQPRREVGDFGDGTAARQIADILLADLS